MLIKNKVSNLIFIAWSLSIVVSAIGILAWGSGLGWQLNSLSTYEIFPLFGILAFSLMWSHYISVALAKFLEVDKTALKKYFKITSLAVLAFILLHPGLLVWQLWRDGFGLPPDSVLNNYVAETAGWAATLGVIGLVIFLSFELHRWFKERSWWRYVQYASDLGMAIIFIHALRLGGELRPSWFRVVWWLYGISLVVAIIYIYAIKPKLNEKESVV